LSPAAIPAKGLQRLSTVTQRLLRGGAQAPCIGIASAQQGKRLARQATQQRRLGFHAIMSPPVAGLFQAGQRGLRAITIAQTQLRAGEQAQERAS
jgi:hypothetical protein